MQHHLGTNLFKGGVYDPTKTVETFFRGKNRHLAPLDAMARLGGHKIGHSDMTQNPKTRQLES
jgi:hypothetical protein